MDIERENEKERDVEGGYKEEGKKCGSKGDLEGGCEGRRLKSK